MEQLPGMRRGEDRATRLESKPRVGWGAATIMMVAAASAGVMLAGRRR
ncbi:MAG: hypothetical protein AVDCRST_MAG91-270 [uncultured Sphingomonadaceae bacterium]|uniref:Uncharacterized protein n=1 Tax=uncultured Sphingomonadaceae bacterium TaxID=169976 RepID=A0A6J4RZB2_9SPHN|nr:MAG: hypothetical protein AVDCRST_MAG91-270 [uncultured Sphingomonadaceae bacterium]